MAYYMEYPIYVWTTQPIPEVQNLTCMTYISPTYVSDITFTENSTGSSYYLSVTPVALTENATGNAYPSTYTYGGISLVGNV